MRALQGTSKCSLSFKVKIHSVVSVATSSFNQHNTFLSQGIFVNQQRCFHPTESPLKELNLAKSIEEFTNDRSNYTPTISLESLRKRLNQEISNDPKAQLVYHQDFNSLVLASKHDEEIDAAFQVIKKNAEKLTQLGLVNQFSNKLGKLLYTLKKTDKFLQIFNNEESTRPLVFHEYPLSFRK